MKGVATQILDYNALAMSRTEKAAKWIIRSLIALPITALLAAMGIGAVNAGGFGWAIVPVFGFGVVCIAISHAEENYGIGWPTIKRILQVALIWLVAFLISAALNWDGKVSFSRMNPESFSEASQLLFWIVSPLLAIISPLMLFFAPGRSLFSTWPIRSGKYRK